MKKQQKEQIKAGGEMARAIYQKFTQRPQWVTMLNPDDIKQLLDFLDEAFDQEMEASILLLEDHTRLEEKGEAFNDRGRHILRESCKHVQRYAAIHRLRNAILDSRTEPGSPFSDFPIYCRDN